MPVEFKKVLEHGTTNPIVARLSLQILEILNQCNASKDIQAKVGDLYMNSLQKKLLRCWEIEERFKKEFAAAGKYKPPAAAPDWIPPVQAAGVKVKIIPSEQYFPHLAQGIGASDQIIKERPDLVRKFVHAALHGMKDIIDDPNRSADEFVSFVPEWKGKEAAVRSAFKYYVDLIYPGQTQLGEVNAERLSKLQDFYLQKGIIQKKSPVEELYTNEFIK